ncbi:MAG: tetratricopeptide repeat protein [Akkermansiaceae bacterium]|nr:tetratricopeptide repeat protein [Akkermansiaceae bacterium]
MVLRNVLIHTLGAVGLATVLATPMAPGQQQPPPVAPAQFDPGDLYFKAYLEVRAAEQLEKAEDYIGAMEKLRKADEMFLTVRKYYPEWKPEMVTGRREKTTETITKVRPEYEKQMLAKRNVVAELEGGVKAPGTTIDPGRDVMPLTPGILEVDPLSTRRLKEAEEEVERLRQQAAAGDISRQNDFLKARLRAAETNVEALRARLASAPMEKEMQALNKRIESLEQEREAMGMALSQSRSAHTESMAKIATLEADLQVMRQKYSDLDRDMKKERDVANDVVAGQRRQLEDMEKALAGKDQELAKANQRIGQLVGELKQSREAFAELRDERDNLLRERDQMAALLKLNEASRIQDLIEQNMALAKNLREANEKVDRLNRESNADKDAYTEALRDLAIAKTQINSLRDEKLAQDKRLAELEARLKSEEKSLAQGSTDADPAEVAVLRDIIQRQLRIQERRRQARDLLVEAAKDLGKKDERLAKAIELFDAQEIALSPEEMKLVAGREVDGEFISPYARDRETVGQATVELNRDIRAFERTAEKSFVAGRLLPTRELYEMILEQNPGYTPALCKLGVVQMKLDDPAAAADAFRRAVELDSGNPFAHRMLGYSLMHLGELPAAEQEIRRATELAPTDAKSLMLLASVCYRLGRIGEAESYFKAVITVDPLISEAYYNLAVLCLRDNRIEDARRSYQKALELGALPDPDLEEKLANP